MPLQANEQVVDGVVTGNVKMLADMAQTAMGVSVQNAVANQQTVQSMVNANLQNGLMLAQNTLQNGMQMAQAVTARSLRFTLDISGEQAAAFEKVLGAQLQDQITELNASLAAGQQFSKTAVTTPPQTGTGGAFGSDAGSALLQQIVNRLAIIETQIGNKT